MNDPASTPQVPRKIDPFWWCRDDERIMQMVWDKACQPLALKMLAELDDPATWGLPPDGTTSTREGDEVK